MRKTLVMILKTNCLVKMVQISLAVNFISIARSLYYDPKILILDEATSQMDKHSEEKLFSKIIKNFEKLTLIVVSHNFINSKFVRFI